MKQNDTNGTATIDPVVHTPKGSKTPRAYVAIGANGRRPTWVRADVMRVILDSPELVRRALESAESEVAPPAPQDDTTGGQSPPDVAALVSALKALGIDPANLGASPKAPATKVSSPAPTKKPSPLASRVQTRARR